MTIEQVFLKPCDLFVKFSRVIAFVPGFSVFFGGVTVVREPQILR